jgi:hypothetical protein
MRPSVFISRAAFAFVFSFLLVTPLSAQTTLDASRSGELYVKLARMDSILFSVVYTCNTQRSIAFFTEDLEFYHDKSGLMAGRKAFIEALEKNFCGDQPKLRRELVPGSLQVFPMDNYGAIQSGLHRFYITEKGQPEKQGGVARFTHVWKFDNNEWRISRALSYDHQPL